MSASKTLFIDGRTSLGDANDHECRPDRSYVDDMPPNWATSKTHLCGVSWPQSTPLQNISACCSDNKPVEVSHACFHYCETELDLSGFSHCVRDKFMPEHYMVSCNFAEGHEIGKARTFMGGLALAIAIGSVFLALVIAVRRKRTASVVI
ncbi:unnamed protein product [Zymoseptoria tritici ST99CH_1A5]|uniref:Uncharacterized protein n=1 Tax=Zymoseptoria tritici ST99CH_1A5 TaxID=1276529 RepID=A0A1Y6LHC6_ZYMTR|nr:unnamed protein product [Zymoseptoria tritici ST99CH_1A5]